MNSLKGNDELSNYRRKYVTKKNTSFVSNIICCSCHDNEKSFLRYGL